MIPNHKARGTEVSGKQTGDRGAEFGVTVGVNIHLLIVFIYNMYYLFRLSNASLLSFCSDFSYSSTLPSGISSIMILATF